METVCVSDFDRREGQRESRSVVGGGVCFVVSYYSGPCRRSLYSSALLDQVLTVSQRSHLRTCSSPVSSLLIALTPNLNDLTFKFGPSLLAHSLAPLIRFEASPDPQLDQRSKRDNDLLIVVHCEPGVLLLFRREHPREEGQVSLLSGRDKG